MAVNSLTEENYLKAMLNLSAITGEISVNDLAKALQIKKPTVTSMMKKLSAKKLVIYTSYQPIKLTEKGRREAGQIIRKHRLTEMFLVEKMGFGWEGVHDIAEQIEHIQSPAFFERMDKILGYPKFDPHGSPIPDRSGKIHYREMRKISDCRPGEHVKLAAVLNTSADFLRFLNSRDLHLGATIHILHLENFDGTMQVQYGKRKTEMLSKMVCERLLVERIKRA